MPYLLIRTSAGDNSTDNTTLLGEASRLIAGQLGKPERYVMVSLEAGVPMLFGGSAEPAVYMELKSIGLPESRTAELSAALAQFATTHLGIPAERVYIEFADAARHMWGFNGGTF